MPDRDSARAPTISPPPRDHSGRRFAPYTRPRVTPLSRAGSWKLSLESCAFIHYGNRIDGAQANPFCVRIDALSSLGISSSSRMDAKLVQLSARSKFVFVPDVTRQTSFNFRFLFLFPGGGGTTREKRLTVDEKRGGEEWFEESSRHEKLFAILS